MAPTAAGTFAAVDLGASSGRVMAARVGPATLDLHEAHRFPNRSVSTGFSSSTPTSDHVPHEM